MVKIAVAALTPTRAVAVTPDLNQMAGNMAHGMAQSLRPLTTIEALQTMVSPAPSHESEETSPLTRPTTVSNARQDANGGNWPALASARRTLSLIHI